MAVIKIVPMPGAVGDKGDEGAPGPQGQQGPAGQNGLPGTPALWSYQGAYNSAAAYAVGDVVVYQGQLYYTKSATTAGTLPTNTTKFDLIAAKGADGTNGTNGADGATPFTLIGAYDNGASYNLGIAVYYNGGTYVRTGNPLNPGYPPEIGAINASWTPIAEKGADGTALNFWNFTGDPGVPTENGAIVTDGLSGRSGGDVTIHATTGGKVVIAGSNGEFLFDSNVASNQIATIGDLENQLNYWDGVDAPQDPAQDGFLIVDGIVTGLGSNLLVSASDRVFIGGNNGEFLNGLSTPENQIATIGDLPTGATGTFTSQDNKLVTVTNGIITGII